MENEIKEKKYIGKYIRNKYGIAKVVDVFKSKYGVVLLKLDNNIVFHVDRETGEIDDKYLSNIYPVTENVKLDERIKDLKDLIEVGDYVNGEYVIHIDNNVENYGDKTIITELNKRYFGSQIINVVTKEMMESISYKVERK